MSRNGHSTFGCALVTGCGSRCVAPEKKLAILSLKDGVLGAAGAGAADGAGGAEPVDAVVAGATAPPPLHPASNDKAKTTAAGDRCRQADPANERFVPRVIANSRSPIAIAK
jgi:hypothetical protein